MRSVTLGVVALSAGMLVASSGCVAVDVGTHSMRPPEIATLVSAYVGLNGIRPYDEKIFRIGIWNMDERPGEIFSFDFWPIVGFGVGLAGARAHVLPVDVGAGAIWYQPVPCIAMPGKEAPAAETPRKAPQKNASQGAI